MAVINAWVLGQSDSGLTYSAFNSSISIEFLRSSDYTYDTYVDQPTGLIISNLPVSALNSVKTGVVLGEWFDDYYNRLHIIPRSLNLGNLLTVQRRDVEIWNSYLYQKTFYSQSSPNDSNTSIIGLNPLTTFAPLQSRTFEVKIDAVGSPKIDTVYAFDFGDDVIYLPITGSRVLLIRYRPNQDIDESLEWFTDVIKTKSRESRIALRQAPRQKFKYTAIVETADFTILKAIFERFSTYRFGLPMWNDRRFVGNVTIGALYVDVDTLYADFRSNDLIAIQHQNGFEVVETLNITSTRITLKQPINSNLANCYVMPVRFATASKGCSISKTPDQLIKAKFDFIISNNVDRSSIVGFQTYKSIPILFDVVYNTSSTNFAFNVDIETFDNESASPILEAVRNYANSTMSISLVAYNKSEQWRIRGFLDYLKGRQKKFYISSKNEDLILLSNIGVGSTSIQVESVNYESFHGPKSIIIFMRDGSYVIRDVVEGFTNDNIDTLNVSSAFSTNVLIDDVEIISFLNCVRLNSDTVELTHHSNQICEFTFTVCEVPDVL